MPLVERGTSDSWPPFVSSSSPNWVEFNHPVVVWFVCQGSSGHPPDHAKYDAVNRCYWHLWRGTTPNNTICSCVMLCGFYLGYRSLVAQRLRTVSQAQAVLAKMPIRAQWKRSPIEPISCTDRTVAFVSRALATLLGKPQKNKLCRDCVEESAAWLLRPTMEARLETTWWHWFCWWGLWSRWQHLRGDGTLSFSSSVSLLPLRFIHCHFLLLLLFPALCSRGRSCWWMDYATADFWWWGRWGRWGRGWNDDDDDDDDHDEGEDKQNDDNEKWNEDRTCSRG